MKLVSTCEAAQWLAKLTKKWVVYISFDDMAPTTQVLKAAPYLNTDSEITWDGHGIIVCNTEAEMEKVFRQTVGDEGPTKLNKYNGSTRVYACTINNKGEMVNTNT